VRSGNSPQVSVLIPARNAAATLRSALASVQAQRFDDWEAIVVDDGSTDDTLKVLMQLNDSRIRVVSSDARGIVGALNLGLEHCRAPLVARFDADDLMHRDRLQLQVEALRQSPQLAGIGSLVRCFPRVSQRDGLRRYEAWLNSLVSAEEVRHARFVEAPLVHPSVTLRTEALRSIGGWHESAWAEDWDLWLRLLERGDEIAKVPRVLHYWRDHPERLTRKDPRYSLEAHMKARAHYLARGPLAAKSAVIWGAGPIGKALMKELDRLGAKVVALVDIDPRKIGQIVHGRRVLRPDELKDWREAILLGSVGAPGARDEIREEARKRGYTEGVDFFACA
jgi:glycosyltransferase involved in cell wall biosynthesis